jgi:FkbM family methyltransferase
MITSSLAVYRHKGLGGLVVAVFQLLKANFLRRVLGIRYVRRNVHDYQMFLDTTDPGISRTLILFGSREEDHRIMLGRALRPGMTVLDIGANIGYYALMASRAVGPQGRVIAIEPSPANIALLKRNIAINGATNISVLCAAVSNTSGTKTFFLSELSNLNTFHADERADQHLTGRTIEVRTLTVPEIVKEFGHPDLIRMDVEGHEVEIFNGMIGEIEAGELSPSIIFETHIRHYTSGHDFVTPLRRLFDAGYVVSIASSSSEQGTAIVDSLGYKGGRPFATDFKTRVLYDNIAFDDAIDLICRRGGIRTVLLERRSEGSGHPATTEDADAARVPSSPGG